MMTTTTAWTCWRDATHVTTVHPLFGWPRCNHCGAAPPYHERPDYVPADLTLGLYVPAKGSILSRTIAPHAAIVGVVEEDRLWLHYEGWLYGPPSNTDKSNHMTIWRAGVESATGRLITAYPTIAQARVQPREVTKIGSYRLNDRVVDLENLRLLMAWLAGS